MSKCLGSLVSSVLGVTWVVLSAAERPSTTARTAEKKLRPMVQMVLLPWMKMVFLPDGDGEDEDGEDGDDGVPSS